MQSGEAVKVERKKANIYSKVSCRDTALAAAMQLCPKSAQHQESHSLHASAGPEDLRQLEEGI